MNAGRQRLFLPGALRVTLTDLVACRPTGHRSTEFHVLRKSYGQSNLIIQIIDNIWWCTGTWFGGTKQCSDLPVCFPVSWILRPVPV